jgi:hypothetical protein
MSLLSWQKDVLTAHEDSNYSFAFVPNLASFFCLLVFFCFVLFPEKTSQTLDCRNNCWACWKTPWSRGMLAGVVGFRSEEHPPHVVNKGIH